MTESSQVPSSSSPRLDEDGLGALLPDEELRAIDAYWRAANYLSVGQVYLLANPLLREPLRSEHVKPRLLGHFGTTPGLNLIYVHLNRAIRRRDLSAIYITGPGHGGPAVVANAYLEGTYSELYPHVTMTKTGSASSSGNSRSLEGFRAMPRRRLPARSTKVASSAMRSPTRTALPSTTRTCSLRAWSATGRPRRARSRPAGTATGS